MITAEEKIQERLDTTNKILDTYRLGPENAAILENQLVIMNLLLSISKRTSTWPTH
jgi:hypothetical protein